MRTFPSMGSTTVTVKKSQLKFPELKHKVKKIPQENEEVTMTIGLS